MSVEQEWHRAMVNIYERARGETGYAATRFLQMVANLGGLAAARRLLQSPDVSEGFTTLWERNRLDLSVENHVLRSEFEELFSDEERAIARERLSRYGFDPDRPSQFHVVHPRREQIPARGTISRLTDFLSRLDQDRVELTFEELESILGGSLPPSARRHAAFWSNSEQNPYSKHWRRAGFIVSRRGLGPGQVAFVRATEPDVGQAREPGELLSIATRADVVLLGCVSQKEASARPAKDLYRSELFRRRRTYAEGTGKPWFVLSAKHGLLEPEQVIEPYDLRLSDFTGDQREQWGRTIAAEVVERIGPLTGRVLEIHAGDTYVSAVRRHLQSAGAIVDWPLQGLRIGEQLAWYASKGVPAVSSEPPSESAFQSRTPAQSVSVELPDGLSSKVTRAFTSGDLDLSARPGAPPPGWQGMPEIATVDRLQALGATSQEIRLFITLLAAMDRARDADRLWFAGADLFGDAPWVFQPEEIARRGLDELGRTLSAAKVSQRHGPDTMAWRLIAERVLPEGAAPLARRAIYEGTGDAVELLQEIRNPIATGPVFPFVSGPKIGPMWVRMLAHPGRAEISSLDRIPVAVDVQVRKVTEYVGRGDTVSRPLESVRGAIQNAWAEDVRRRGAAGPPALENTPAALDPALWFYGKWGCTWCERANRRVPISEICGLCRFDEMRLATRE